MKKVLIVDDCSNMIRALYRLLQPEAYDLYSASHPLDALAMLESETFDLVLSDNRMPDMEGIELLTRAKKLQPGCIRIGMSAYRDFESLIAAFNDGTVHHFVQKPWDNSALKNLLKGFLKPDKATASDEQARFPQHIVSHSPAMQSVLAKVELLRGQNTPVFIHGETGTGKELIAKRIHELSATRNGNFVAINASNLSPELLESQLFGHRKGAFTGAIRDQVGLLQHADGGTLFLDEITDLPAVVQSKLLRVFQEREFTPVGETEPRSFSSQIVSASSTHLADAVAAKSFRADLMYRLDVFPINLPPLRDRQPDILPLFHHFSGCETDAEAEACLLGYSWPGNIRELQNAAMYARTSARGASIAAAHLPERLQGHDIAITNHLPAPLSQRIDQSSIQAALAQAGHNKSVAAAILGISRMTLWRHMKKLSMC